MYEPDLTTQQLISELTDQHIRQFPTLLGVDETIPNCQVIDDDPDGDSPAVPRYFTVAQRNFYYNDVLYRGSPPGLSNGDYCTVLHMRDGDIYEILGPGGATGSWPPIVHDHSSPAQGGVTVDATDFGGIATVSAIWNHTVDVVANAGDFSILDATAQFAPTGNFNTNVWGFRGSTTLTTAQTRVAGGAICGIEGTVVVDNGIDARDLQLFGGQFYVDVEDAGVGGGVGASFAIGVRVETPRVDTGSCDWGVGVWVEQGHVGAGSIADLMGVYIDPLDAGSTVWGIYVSEVFGAGDNTGLYMEDVWNGATNYAIFTNLGLVYFGDRVGINEIAPGAMLQVNTSGAAVVGAIIKGSAAQAANLLELQNNTAVVTLSATGYDAVTAFQVNKEDTTNVLTVDTINARVGINNANPVSNLTVTQTFVDRTGIWITGRGLHIASPTDNTKGFVFLLNWNAVNNRQLYFGASDHVGVGTRAMFRLVSTQLAARLNAISGDGATRLPLALGSSKSDVAVGGVSLAYNEVLPGKLSVYCETAKVGLAVRGAAAQAASLLQLQTSAPAVFFDSGDGLTGSVFSGNIQMVDIDFIWAGDNEANLFRVDAGLNVVHMGDWDTNYFSVDRFGDTKWVGGGGLVFGSCYGNHIAWVQANAVQNTWYNVSDADMVSGELHNVAHDGSGKLTVTEPGRYLVIYSVCYEDNQANDHLEAGIEINGSGAAELSGRTHIEAKFANQEEHLGSGTVLNLGDNATIEVAIRTTDAGTPTITVHAVNLSVVIVGG